MTGNKKVTDVGIAPEAVDPEDVEMLQDLILMATNDVLSKIDEATKAKLGKFASAIPGF
jgi:DNA-binding protein YbaB